MKIGIGKENIIGGGDQFANQNKTRIGRKNHKY